MELKLKRKHYDSMTVGVMYEGSEPLMYCIEAPPDDKGDRGCITQGRYRLLQKINKQHGYHFSVETASGKFVYIRGAETAAAELKGDIIPAMLVDCEGRGLQRKVAMQKLMLRCKSCIENNETIFLTIETTEDSI